MIRLIDVIVQPFSGLIGRLRRRRLVKRVTRLSEADRIRAFRALVKLKRVDQMDPARRGFQSSVLFEVAHKSQHLR